MNASDTGGTSTLNIINNHRSSTKFGLLDKITFDNYPYYQIYKNLIDIYNVYYIMDIRRKKVACFTYMILTKLGGQKVLKSKFVNTLEGYTGKHMAMKLYQTIRHSENIPIISDEAQSTSGRKLWKNLNDSFPVSVVNKNSGEYVSHNIHDAYMNWNENTATVSLNDDENILMLETIENHSAYLVPGFLVYK